MILLGHRLGTLLRSFLVSLLTVGMSLVLAHPGAAWAMPLPPSPLVGYLPPGNAITDGQALLRYALPIDNEAIRTVQTKLEGLSDSLRGNRWGAVKGDIKKVDRTLDKQRAAILEAVTTDHKTDAEAIIADLKTGLQTIQAAADTRDKEQIWATRSTLLTQVSRLEEYMVKGFPFEVPADYQSLPQLKGRATVTFKTNKGTMTAVIDGYSAPVTAGNFIDLVQRGFYDGLEFIRAEDFYVLQTGDPVGADEGFIDPKTGQYRAIPLEILVQGDDKPVYGDTLESLGRYLDAPVLPFSAFGTLGMARPGDDPNGGSSQFFFFLFEPELTPAGLNLLDGRYAVFGYVVEGKEILNQLKAGDRIESAQVTTGLENLVEPGS